MTKSAFEKLRYKLPMTFSLDGGETTMTKHEDGSVTFSAPEARERLEEYLRAAELDQEPNRIDRSAE